MVFLGESFGGPLAILVASTKPPGLAGVVLCASFAKFPLQSLRAMAPIVRMAPIFTAPRAVLGWLFLGGTERSGVLDVLVRVLRRLDRSVLRTRMEATLRVDVLGKCADLKVPLLCIRATRDRVVPGTAAAAICNVAPQAQVLDVPAPHFVLQSCPREPADAVVRFANGAAF